MYEHPYLSYRVTTLELEQVAAAAERRRMISENPERIIRRAGIVRRMLDALARGGQNVPASSAPPTVGHRADSTVADCLAVKECPATAA